MTTEDRAHLEKLLRTYTRNKQYLENQAANFGGVDNAPLNVINSLDAVNAQIADIQQRLAALGSTPASGGTSGGASSSGGSSGGSLINMQGNDQRGANVTFSGNFAGGNVVSGQGNGGSSSSSTGTSSAATGPSRPAPIQATLSFQPTGDGSAWVTWGGELLRGKRTVTKFSPPYGPEALATVIKALDAAQYPNYPVDGPQFTADEQQTLTDLKLWQSGRIASNVHKLVGKQIYQALGPDGIAALKVFRDEGFATRKQVSYVLRFPEEAVQIAALPWEALTDERNKAVLLTRGSDIDSCERYMDLDIPVPPPLSGGEKPHILALCPGHNISDDVRKGERAARLATWDGLRDQGLLTYDEIGPPLTVAAVNDYIRSYERKTGRRPDVIHYYGHGVYRDDQGYLIFDSDTGGKARISTERLTAILGDIRLMVIFACESSRFEDEGGLLTGLAPSLSLITGAVVAMQLTTRMSAATRFTKVFYDELLNGKKSLQDAVAEGRQTLFAEEEDGASWYVPTLYIRSQQQEPFFLVR